MGVSIEEYRQRIGCFARVGTVSFKIRGNNRHTLRTQTKDFGTVLRVIIRLSCLVVLVTIVIQRSSFVLDLTQFGDVEKNPGPPKPDTGFKFHLMTPRQFENFAGHVLEEKYGVDLKRFAGGSDGGVDLSSVTEVSIRFGGEDLTKQNVVVQVKHTDKELKSLTTSLRKSRFENSEGEKFKKLVAEKKLNIYIIFTNFKLPADQSGALFKFFTDAGGSGVKVDVVGYETLCEWLKSSPVLRNKMLRLYPIEYISDIENTEIVLRSVRNLKVYEEELKKIIDVEVFTRAQEMVESEKGLVFITGAAKTGKTIVAWKLVSQLSEEYYFFNINSPQEFIENWAPVNGKYLFFMDKIGSEALNEWCNYHDEFKMAIERGTKFVLAGIHVAFNVALAKSDHHVFYKCLCDAVINLSDGQFNLRKEKKCEMLQKHVEMGDNDDPIKEALLKHDMLSYAAGIDCPCFPYVASSLGSSDSLKEFLEIEPTTVVYDQEFLNRFFTWVQSKLPQLETDSGADNGYNITGSSGEFSGEPALKRPRLEAESAGDNEYDITALKGILCEKYKDRASRLHVLPWLDARMLKLENMYINLEIVQRDNLSQLTHKTVELHEIFDKREHNIRENPRTILIEGSPGMGKTTLSLKLAYDWAVGKMPANFPPIQLVFLIKCRDMKCGILEEIYKQFFPSDKDSLKEDLQKFIKEQPDKILLVIDGLDEFSTQAAEDDVMELLKGKCLRECFVVATSRQVKGIEVRKYFDTLLEIKGFSKEHIVEYIKRYFQDRNHPSRADNLITSVLHDDGLRKLATNPLSTLLLCIVFARDDGNLPSTVTELYEKIVSFITKRYRINCGLSVEDERLETYKETLGTLAYKGLAQDPLSFCESDLNVDDTECTKMGFVYMEVGKEDVNRDDTYWFLHKTLQEYLAAFYLTTRVKEKKLTVDDMVEQWKDPTKFVQVSMFVSGMLGKKYAAQLKLFVDKLGTVLLQSPNMDKIKVVGILCAVLSECVVDNDMAEIVLDFLPLTLFCGRRYTPYGEYIARTLPDILNFLCTEDGVNKEVYFDKISFGSHQVMTSDVEFICKALKKNLKVTELDLSAGNLDNETARALADMLSQNCTVEILDLGDNNLTQKAAEILATGLSQNTTLKDLNLSYNDLGDVGVKAIIAAITPDNSFTDMATCNNDSDSEDDDSDGDLEDVRRGSALQILYLIDTKCGEEGASAMADMLRTNNTLTKLYVNNNSLNCKGVTYLAEALKSNKTLYELYINSTGCGDYGVYAIADMLRSNDTLQRLDLNNYLHERQYINKVGKDGAVALAGALQVNKSLKQLHLYDNDITDEGLKCLAEALLKNTTLESLCIKYPGDGLRALDQDTKGRLGEITWVCDAT